MNIVKLSMMMGGTVARNQREMELEEERLSRHAEKRRREREQEEWRERREEEEQARRARVNAAFLTIFPPQKWVPKMHDCHNSGHDEMLSFYSEKFSLQPGVFLTMFILAAVGLFYLLHSF